MFRFIKSFFSTCADNLVSFSRTFGRQAWLICLIVLSLTIVIFQPFASYSQTKFSDVKGHWAQACIEDLTTKQIISGYPDGTFKPSSSVTRAEFAAMISKAFNTTVQTRNHTKFSDVPETYWAAEPISFAYQTGFMSGYPDGVFKPNEKIPRGQVLVSLANGLNYTQEVQATEATSLLKSAFKDAQSIPEYAQSPIAAAMQKELIVNYPQVQTLNPNQTATRAEVAAFLCQALGNSGLVPSQYISSARAVAAPKNELRGVWITNIDSDVLFEKNRLATAIKTLRRLNFNTLYPVAWNWGYTLYPSAVAKKEIGTAIDPTPGLQKRDILKEIVAQGHQKGMSVIPWFEFGFMAPADSDLAKRHPEWILKRSDGAQIWKEGPHDRVWLNPFRPDVQQFILDLIGEIVANYDIDGIQFDDHFGFPFEFGYDNFTVELYKQEHNGQSPPTDPKNPEWIKWRADKITTYMERVFRAIKQKKQNVIVSLSPNPQEFSYNFFLADWQTWERKGLIEELIIQVYRNDIDKFIGELERPEVQAARKHIPVAIGILTGVKPRAVPMKQIQAQVQATRSRRFAGVSFFFYESLWKLTKEPAVQRQSGIKKLFKAYNSRPSILKGWKPTA